MSKRNQPSFGTTPRADLLPSKQRAALVHERTMPKLLIALLASGAVALLIALAGALPVQLAEQRLAGAEAESARLFEELSEHAETQQYLGQIEAVASQVLPLTEKNVRFIDQLDLIRAMLPQGSRLENFTGALGVESAVAEGVCAEGAVVMQLVVHTPNLTASEAFLRSLRGLDGYLCAEAIDVRGGTAQVTSTVQLVLDESVREQAIAEENDS